MLRRSHDHHRGLRARCNATASADSSNDRHQDRHLMTALTIPQICSSRSPALDRPRQSAPRYAIVVANRPTVHRVRRHPPLIRRQPLHRRTTRCTGSNSNQPARPRHSNPHSACGTVLRSLSAVSSLGGFRTPAAEYAAPSLMRPASETLHRSRHPQVRRLYRLCAEPRHGELKSRKSESRPKAALNSHKACYCNWKRCFKKALTSSWDLFAAASW